MRFESAEISLVGDRSENQDRIVVERISEESLLLICIDGMGGHSDGALAAKVASETIARAYRKAEKPIIDPQGFMVHAIGNAHTALVNLGADQSMEARPRATCALCLIQDDAAWWAHVGDSRIYHLSNTGVNDRTRDHSHVEVLLQEGLIREEEMANHPMRNFVECCLGGDSALPGMSITAQKRLAPGDLVLTCTDGFWGSLPEEQVASLSRADGELSQSLEYLAQIAVRLAAPHSDNASAAVVRFNG